MAFAVPLTEPLGSDAWLVLGSDGVETFGADGTVTVLLPRLGVATEGVTTDGVLTLGVVTLGVETLGAVTLGVETLGVETDGVAMLPTGGVVTDCAMAGAAPAIRAMVNREYFTGCVLLCLWSR
jgi:hypothetical protein